MASFNGFLASDFAAYAPTKWSSHAYNLERQRVKEKLTALGREFGGLQPAAGGAPLATEVSVENPAVWNQNRVSNQTLYFARSEEERRELFSRISRARPISALLSDPSPLRDHIFLCIIVDQSGVSVGLQLHPDADVDRRNLLTKLSDHWQLQTFTETLNEVPDEFRFGLANEEPVAPGSLDPEGLQGIVRRFAEAPTGAPLGEARILRLMRSYEATDPLLLEATFARQARQDLGALLPVYHFIAWCRQNDYVSETEAIREEKKIKKARGIARDDRVRVVKGLFTGKKGVVMEIDSKGGLKVRLGTMVVKLDAQDVARL